MDGYWSDWGSWGACSVTCGAGLRFRYRVCNNPPPKYGASCASSNSSMDQCAMPRCDTS